jgi:hypothetical protein|tara:strand:- start:9648 stop:10292 length:645 start_codon:yes stop_codon:yes gene_type:complete
MQNYIIVLFKNKKKKKIIKGYQSEKRAFQKFKSLINNNNYYFSVKYENAEESKYEIALLSNQDSFQIPLFQEDDMGRNEEIFISTKTDYIIKEIKPYKLEEKIYDWQSNIRITFDELIKNYCIKKEMKSISTLHNKLVIQINDNFNLFSLKNIDDSHRLIETMEKYFRDNNRSDSIFVKDISTTQRKWMYDLLVDNGFDKKKLYRQTTTFSKRK